MKNVLFDIANYIINKCPRITNMKLQKLVYYAHAHFLTTYNKPLIDSPIEAWVYGPVIRDLYLEFAKYTYNIITSLSDKGNIDNLTLEQKEPLDYIINLYGNLSAQELSDKPTVKTLGKMLFNLRIGQKMLYLMITYYIIIKNILYLKMFKYSFHSSYTLMDNSLYSFKKLKIKEFLEDILYPLSIQYVGKKWDNIKNKDHFHSICPHRLKQNCPSISTRANGFTVYQLPLSKRTRICGIIINNIFYIIAYDKNHTLYNMS